jgi:hypothetical protein
MSTAARDMPSKKTLFTKKNPAALKKAAKATAQAAVEYKQAVDIALQTTKANEDDRVRIIGGPLDGFCGIINCKVPKNGQATVYFIGSDEKHERLEMNKDDPACKFLVLESAAAKQARVYLEIKALRDAVMAEVKEKLPELLAFQQLQKQNEANARLLTYWHCPDGDKKHKYTADNDLCTLYDKVRSDAMWDEYSKREAAGRDERIPIDFFTPYPEWAAEFTAKHAASVAKEFADREKLITQVLAHHPLLAEPGLFKVLTLSHRDIKKHGNMDSKDMDFFPTDPEFKQGFFGLNAWQHDQLGQLDAKDSPMYLRPSTLNPDCVLHWAMLVSKGIKGPCQERLFHRSIDGLKQHWGMERYKKLLALLMFFAHGVGLISTQLYIYSELQNVYDIKPDSIKINDYEKSLIELFR